MCRLCRVQPIVITRKCHMSQLRTELVGSRSQNDCSVEEKSFKRGSNVPMRDVWRFFISKRRPAIKERRRESDRQGTKSLWPHGTRSHPRYNFMQTSNSRSSSSDDISDAINVNWTVCQRDKTLRWYFDFMTNIGGIKVLRCFVLCFCDLLGLFWLLDNLNYLNMYYSRTLWHFMTLLTAFL